jgi:hypothetical protein
VSNSKRASGHVDGGVPTVMSLEEFYSAGFLQEVNRLFFHPHGLSLNLKYKGKSSIPVGLVVLDGRFDPEGFMYGEEELDYQKVIDVFSERQRHTHARIRRLQNERGTDIQEVGMPEAAPEDPRSKLTVF